MMNSLDVLKVSVEGSTFWVEHLDRCEAQPPLQIGLHLGVFVEPFLQFILEGRKSVDSRFSVRKCAPYRQVVQGDILLLKRPGGPVVGLAEISNVWFYRIEPKSMSELRREFAEAMCAADPEFWEAHKTARYATLMRLSNVIQIPPVDWGKRDRRGWAVLRRRSSQRTLW